WAGCLIRLGSKPTFINRKRVFKSWMIRPPCQANRFCMASFWTLRRYGLRWLRRKTGPRESLSAFLALWRFLTQRRSALMLAAWRVYAEFAHEQPSGGTCDPPR